MGLLKKRWRYQFFIHWVPAATTPCCHPMRIKTVWPSVSFFVRENCVFFFFLCYLTVLAVVFLFTWLQFQEAFSSTDGRIKLVHSMEGIVKGSQQVMLFSSSHM